MASRIMLLGMAMGLIFLSTSSWPAEDVVKLRRQPGVCSGENESPGEVSNGVSWRGCDEPRDFKAYTFKVYTQNEVDERLATLNARLLEVSKQIQVLQEQILTQEENATTLRNELLRRIGQIPFELAKDAESYRILKNQLVRDLAEVFEQK